MLQLLCPYCLAENFRKDGLSAPAAAFQGRRRQRYFCRPCGRRFSEHSLALHFRMKKPDPALNAKIFHLCMDGLSNRRIARIHAISEHCVRIRLERMARQALYFHAQKMRDVKIYEPICFDGLENFAGSQYDVNNIQQALGSESLFVYDFNLATMNRKGRMSPWQRRRLREIEEDAGRYNPRAIRIATGNIVRRLQARWANSTSFVFRSDEHFQYRRAIHVDLKHLKIDHQTISSKECRNFQNILFAVNHLDLLIRKDVAAFTRETISFSKTHAAMCQKYALYVVTKNYMRPQFTKTHKRRPEAHLKSPAEHVGLCTRLLEFEDIFHRRPLDTDVKALNHDWCYLVRGEVPPNYRRSRQFRRKTRKENKSHKPAA